MKFRWYWIIGIILACLIIGIFIGIYFKSEQKTNCPQQNLEITKEKYCKWIEFADVQENLIIAQRNLLESYGVPIVSNDKWITLAEEMEKCK